MNKLNELLNYDQQLLPHITKRTTIRLLYESSHSTKMSLHKSLKSQHQRCLRNQFLFTFTSISVPISLHKVGNLCISNSFAFSSCSYLIFLILLKHATATAILNIPIIQPHLPSILLIPANILLACSAISVFLWSFLCSSHPEQVLECDFA